MASNIRSVFEVSLFGGSRKHHYIKSEGASLHGLLFRELVGSAHFRGQLMEKDHLSKTTYSLLGSQMVPVAMCYKVTKRHCYIIVLVIKVNTILQGLRSFLCCLEILV